MPSTQMAGKRSDKYGATRHRNSPPCSIDNRCHFRMNGPAELDQVSKLRTLWQDRILAIQCGTDQRPDFRFALFGIQPSCSLKVLQRICEKMPLVLVVGVIAFHKLTPVRFIVTPVQTTARLWDLVCANCHDVTFTGGDRRTNLPSEFS